MGKLAGGDEFCVDAKGEKVDVAKGDNCQKAYGSRSRGSCLLVPENLSKGSDAENATAYTHKDAVNTHQDAGNEYMMVDGKCSSVSYKAADVAKFGAYNKTVCCCNEANCNPASAI